MKNPTPTSPPRVVLYSHDAVGLGHLRRNLAIAAAVVRAEPGAHVLVVSGHHQATSFECPRGVGILTLPGIGKRDRSYVPRSLGGSLAEILELRSAVISAAVTEFDPDVLLVDKLASGLEGELLPTLRSLAKGGRARCVLGLRDVLDHPITTQEEWRRAHTAEVVEQYYDDIWWYGDARVFDPVAEYRLSTAMAARSRMTGYLAHHRPLVSSGVDRHLLEQPFDLCLVGGGEDGAGLARSFAAAPRVDDVRRIVVAGPFMPNTVVAELAAVPDVTVVRSVPDCTELIANARAVVAMGGYNVVCELLAAGVHPLIAPRTRPRVEQAIRAERLAALGAVDVLDGGGFAPREIGRWLTESAHVERRSSHVPIDLDGLRRLPGLIAGLLQRPAAHDIPALAPPTEEYRHASA